MSRSRATNPSSKALSPLGAVVRGAVAGAVGTVALDAANYAQYRAGGGTDDPLAWEFTAGLDSWDDAPAPAQVGRRLYEGLTQHRMPPGSARLVNNITHWGYGIFWGARVRSGGGIDPAPEAPGPHLRDGRLAVGIRRAAAGQAVQTHLGV